MTESLTPNADVYTKYINQLGVENLKFVDVFGLDYELLLMVPLPVYAVLLLFRFTDKAKVSPIGTLQKDTNLYFIKQEMDNACGILAIIHALANNEQSLADGTPIKTFIDITKGMTPQERARYLATDKNMGYDTSHHGNAEEDQFETPAADQKVNMQCVTFVHEEGALYGMDGKNDGPIKYGNTIEETLLQDAAEVIKRFIDDRDPDEHQYIVMALVKK